MANTNGSKLTDKRFYVYVVAIAGRIRYVGKGTGNRSSSHLRRSHNTLLRAEIAEARAAKKTVRVKHIADHLAEDQALALEMKAIRKLGKDKLCNVAPFWVPDAEKTLAECFYELECHPFNDAISRSIRNHLRIAANMCRDQLRAINYPSRYDDMDLGDMESA